MASRAASRTLTDHQDIRRWAEERGATPACVRGTGGGKDTGMIRLDFPGYSGAQSLEPIDWNDWFQKFDESRLALLVQDETARGERSNFNKLIGRETARARAEGDNRASRRHPERSHRGTSRARTGTRSRSAGSAGTRKKASASKSSSSRRKSTSNRSARTTSSSSSSRSKRSSSSRSSSRGRSTTGKSSSRGNSRSAASRRETGTRSSAARSKRAPSSSRSRSNLSRPSARSRTTSSRSSARSSSSTRGSRGRTSSATNNFLTDHEEIRRWAEERSASPACVRGTGGGEDVGMIRLDFPGYTGAQSLEHIDWDEWFQKFDDNNLALLVQNKTTRGQKSNFNKLVSRETAEQGSRARASSARKSSSSSRGASSRRRAA